MPPPAPSRARRWAGPAIAAILLHLIGLLWADGSLHLQRERIADQPSEKIISATLQPSEVRLAPPPGKEVIAPVPPKPRRPAPPARPSPPATIVADSPATAEIIAASPPAPATAVEIAPTAPVQPPAPPVLAQAAADAPPPVAVAPTDAAAQFRISPPPPVMLKYDVMKIAVDGQNLYGHGSISWQLDGQRYVINGDAGILFLSALSFKSEGEIDKYGISPEVYSEKRFRKSATNTHFRRDAKLISFSASETNYPRQGGEQDRASIIWQLAGIGRGDSGKIAAGVDINIFVAGVRDGEIWPIHVIGKEEIDIGPGKTSVWHLARAPKPGSYDQKLDIWLAPEMEWYPVKLRYTETNGDYLDLSLSSLTASNPR